MWSANDLVELIQRQEKPSRAVDRAIEKFLWPTADLVENGPHFTNDLTHVLRLFEILCPKWVIANMGMDDGRRWWIELRHGFATSYDKVIVVPTSIPGTTSFPTKGLANLSMALSAAIVLAKEYEKQNA